MRCQFKSNALAIAGSVSEHWVTVGGRIGMHTFAADAFSIDPSLMLGYVTGSGESPFGELAPGAPRNYDIGGFVIGLHVALSGWIGGT
jgi:hypothetical protein